MTDLKPVCGAGKDGMMPLEHSLGIIIYGLNGRAIHISEAVISILGLSQEELTGQTPAHDGWKAILPDGSAISDPSELRVKAMQATNGLIGIMDGEKPVRWIVIHTAPIKDAARGNATGTVVQVIDAVGHMRVEDRSLWNEALLRAMVDCCPLALYVVDDRTDDILLFNDRFVNIWGLGAWVNEMNSKAIKNADLVKFFSSIVRDGRSFIEPYGRNKSIKDFTILEDILKLSDGRVIRCYSAPMMDNNGGYFGRLFLYEDITDKKRFEEALEVAHDTLEARVKERTAELVIMNESLIDREARLLESEKKYRLLVENINDIVWETDKDLNIKYVSPRVSDQLGYTQDEIIGKKPDFILVPETMQHLTRPTQESSKSYESFRMFEATVYHKDGRALVIESSGSPVFDKDGDLAGFRGVSRDITRRKRAEEALNDAKMEAELYVDLMGHDINNINHIGMGYLELALEKTKNDCDINAMLSKSYEMLNNSSRLIDNVRKLQRAKADDLRHEPIDLGHVIESVLSEYAYAPNRRVTIRYEPVNGRIVKANELLEDVFSNLIMNAIKHSTVPVTIDLCITEETINARHYHIVTVEDDGPGVPDELKDRIFNRLERGKSKAVGRGLGLFLVKALVEGFGGHVWVEDRIQGESGRGSRFVVMLPEYETKQV